MKGCVKMEEFNYVYYLRLRFANPNPKPQNFSFKSHEAYFIYCVEKYNKAAKNARNKKRIDVLNINDDNIEIRLNSNADLTKAPGRALMYLTTLLLRNDTEDKEETNFDDFFANNLYYNKLFHTEQYSVSKNIQELSDADFIKGLIDYISKPKSEVSEKDKSTMNRIKLIALENGLVD